MHAVSGCVGVQVPWVIDRWQVCVCVCVCVVGGVGGRGETSTWSEWTAERQGCQHGHPHWRRYVHHAMPHGWSVCLSVNHLIVDCSSFFTSNAKWWSRLDQENFTISRFFFNKYLAVSQKRCNTTDNCRRVWRQSIYLLILTRFMSTPSTYPNPKPNLAHRVCEDFIKYWGLPHHKCLMGLTLATVRQHLVHRSVRSRLCHARLITWSDWTELVEAADDKLVSAQSHPVSSFNCEIWQLL